MNDRVNNIFIDEKVFETVPVTDNKGEPVIDKETGKPKLEVIEKIILTREFNIKKFNAKTSLKIIKLLAAKIIPVFDQFIGVIKNGIDTQSLTTEDIINNLGSFEGISKALDLISDDDMDKLIDTALKHCYEVLAAGETKVLNDNGTYGVTNIENDPVLILRLVIEAILFSVQGFFDVNRLTSILQPLENSFKLNA